MKTFTGTLLILESCQEFPEMMELTRVFPTRSCIEKMEESGQSSSHLSSHMLTEQPLPILQRIPCIRNPAKPLIFFQIHEQKELERIEREKPFLRYLDWNQLAYKEEEEIALQPKLMKQAEFM